MVVSELVYGRRRDGRTTYIARVCFRPIWSAGFDVLLLVLFG